MDETDGRLHRVAGECLRRVLGWLCLSLVLLPSCVSVAADTWQRSGVEREVPGALGVRETVWRSARPPAGPHDRIALHRYRASGKSRAALFYLPGTNMNGEPALEREDHNLWIFLAARGVEVWALDYRTHFVAADLGRSGADDPEKEFMLDWTLEVFLEDARAAVAFAREKSGHEKLFVSGFSRGATFAWAFASSFAAEVAGVVILDGSFKSHAPTGRFDFAAARTKLVAEQRYATDVAGRMGWEKRHQLMSAAARDPAGPATDSAYDSVGEQVASILYKAWRPGALANPKDGFSRAEVLAQLLDGYDRWWPVIQNPAGQSISDYDDDPRTPIDDGWGELQMPILYFGATGMGSRWILDGIYSAARSGSKDVTLHLLEGYGHLDVLVGEHARQEVFEPTLAWIQSHSE